MHLDDVQFDISPDAAAAVRGCGGHLWVWATDDGWPYGTTERPASQWAEWWTYDRDGLLVHVDRAIVPPKRWVILEAAAEQRRLRPRWNGLDPSSPFGRVPFVRREKEPVEAVGSPLVTWLREKIAARRR